MLAKLVSESFCFLVTHTALLGLNISYHFAYIANYHWVNPMAIKWQSKLSVFHLGSIPIKYFQSCTEYRGLLQLHYSVLLRSGVEFWSRAILLQE